MANNEEKNNGVDINQLPSGPVEEWDPEKKAQALARRKKRRGEKPLGLSITSLMDITTIIMFFLMMSGTSDPLNVTQGLKMQLANSTANVSAADDTITILVDRTHIVLDGKAVVEIDCTIDKGQCTDADFEKLNKCEASPDDEICSKEIRLEVNKQDKEKADPNSLIIEPLRKELDKLVKEQMTENEALGRKFKGVVTLILDRNIPFRLFMEVIYTAGKVGVKGKGGLSQFRFAIVRVGAGA